NEPTMSPINDQSSDITLDKHWHLQPGLALFIEDLDFKPPPTSPCSAFTWDTPKKKLTKHLVTKMDKMRRAQGHPFIAD
ncbi:hypothetical protein MJO29_013612, partial [Puccinia striiformis f. sp. tritici]